MPLTSIHSSPPATFPKAQVDYNNKNSAGRKGGERGKGWSCKVRRWGESEIRHSPSSTGASCQRLLPEWGAPCKECQGMLGLYDTQVKRFLHFSRWKGAVMDDFPEEQVMKSALTLSLHLHSWRMRWVVVGGGAKPLLFYQLHNLAIPAIFLACPGSNCILSSWSSNGPFQAALLSLGKEFCTQPNSDMQCSQIVCANDWFQLIFPQFIS